MPHLSLRQASQQFAVSRQTLGKALEKGVISGMKDGAGNWQIDSAELIRVYKPRPQSGRTRPPMQSTAAMPKHGPLQAAAAVDDSAVTIARLTAELAAEKELRAVERELLQRQLDEFRRLLPAPDAKPRRRWWPWR